LAVFLTTVPAWALKVTWTTNGVTQIVFQDDYEENYGAGIAGDRDPVADTGTFTVSESSSNTAVQVLQEGYQAGLTYLPVGGAFEGNEFLTISRLPKIGEPTAAFSKGAVASGALHAEWMMYIPTTNSWNPLPGGTALAAVPAIALLKSNSMDPAQAVVWLAAARRLAGNIVTNALAQFDGIAWRDIYIQDTTQRMTWRSDCWQKWALDYNFVSGVSNDTWRVTVDGVQSCIVTAKQDAAVGWMSFRPNGNDATCVYHIDAVTNGLPLLLHYDFEEAGAGPWSTATDKAGPHYYTGASPIGGGTLNLTNFQGGHGLLLGAGVNAADGIPISMKALDLGQGMKKEFDIDYREGLIVEATLQLTNYTSSGTIAEKTGSWGFGYNGASGNEALSNRFYFGVCTAGYPSGITRCLDKRMTADNADHIWRLRAEWYPCDQGSILRMKLHDLTDGTVETTTWSDDLLQTQTSLLRVSKALLVGTCDTHYYPFPGILDDMKIYGWGEPARMPPPAGTVILMQ